MKLPGKGSPNTWWRQKELLGKFERKQPQQYIDRETVVELVKNLKKRWRVMDYEWRNLSYNEIKQFQSGLYLIIVILQCIGRGDDPIEAVKDKLQWL